MTTNVTSLARYLEGDRWVKGATFDDGRLADRKRLHDLFYYNKVMFPQPPLYLVIYTYGVS